MDNPDRHELHREQTDDLYRAIGKFAVKFEHLVFSMRLGIGFILSKHGLADQQLSNIMLAELTAQPMKNILASMIPQIMELSDTDKHILKSILKRVQFLIDKRNEIIHSTWFVGWARTTDTEFDTVHGYKLTREKSGIGAKSFRFRSEDFDKFSDDCDLVAHLVKTLWGAVVNGDKITDDFVISEDGEITSLWKRQV